MPEIDRRRATDIASVTAINSINSLAEEIAKLTRIREEAQARVLEDHTTLLASINLQLSVLVERTNSLTDLAKRVATLELFQSRSVGFAAGLVLIGGVIGWTLNYIHH